MYQQILLKQHCSGAMSIFQQKNYKIAKEINYWTINEVRQIRLPKPQISQITLLKEKYYKTIVRLAILYD